MALKRPNLFICTSLTRKLALPEKEREREIAKLRHSVGMIEGIAKRCGASVWCAFKEGNWKEEGNPRDFVPRDLKWAKECDAAILFPEASYGVRVEMGWLSAFAKPMLRLHEDSETPRPRYGLEENLGAAGGYGYYTSYEPGSSHYHFYPVSNLVFNKTVYNAERSIEDFIRKATSIDPKLLRHGQDKRARAYRMPVYGNWNSHFNLFISAPFTQLYDEPVNDPKARELVETIQGAAKEVDKSVQFQTEFLEWHQRFCNVAGVSAHWSRDCKGAILFPEASYGVRVEMGWLSAFGKPMLRLHEGEIRYRCGLEKHLGHVPNSRVEDRVFRSLDDVKRLVKEFVESLNA
ncbi:hypothetical protein H0O00_03570 [Candidatus Micrarchaeota archaeon]|nr:hypothetical protein [Candidatus Micrarchaeota archaeon]